MRFFLTILMLLAFLRDAHSQGDTSVNVPKLLMIFEKPDFKALVKLVQDLSYIVLDSSKEKNGSIIYIAREFKVGGNTISCNILPDKKISILGFYTHDSVLSGKLKKQIEASGFKTKGKNSFDIPGYIETQDFNKGKVQIGYGVRKDYSNTIEYGFEFLKF